MNAKNEIEKLKTEFMSLKSETEILDFRTKIGSFLENRTEEEKEDIYKAYTESANEAIDRAEKLYSYVNVKSKLSKVLDVVSISYIAETYFKKSRSWFSQRLNGHLVNGVPVSFTDKEIKILSDSLDDIGIMLQNTARSIA
ncbi:MAG: DUF5053 domain-containing protein [Candidatus Symbiothrix sp.]|jgi:hypothetical protein|nr:DUF5053 domain-containing protein [Candidatus Symbiothrix sp.]